MADLFLPFFAVAVVGMAIAGSIRLLVHYQRADVSKFAASLACKVIIVIGLTLAWTLVLLLPLDVRNARPGPGIPHLMPVVWRAAFWLLAAMIMVVVPGAMFYNDVEDDDSVKSKKKYVLCYMGASLFFGVAIVGISYPFLSHIDIPVAEYECGAWVDGDVAVTAEDVCGTSRPGAVKARAGLEVYLVAVLCFIGWVLLSVFGGIGLSAVPVDLIVSFLDRPRPVDEATYVRRKRVLAEAAQTLIEGAEELRRLDDDLAQRSRWTSRGKRRSLQKEFNKFKRDSLLLEDEFERLRVAKFERGENLAVSYAKLVLGLTFATLSLAWVAHVALYVLIAPGGMPFCLGLNSLFELFEHPGLYPVGVAIFAAFGLYLLLCVVKGCLKFGMRFLYFSVHPMRFKDTPLSSILFNVEMLLLSSAAVVQFVQQSFADYTRLTDADAIFAAQVKYMRFFGVFFRYNIFVYLMLLWALVSLIYLIRRPRDRGEAGLDAASAERLEALANPSARALGTGRQAAAPSASVLAPLPEERA